MFVSLVEKFVLILKNTFHGFDFAEAIQIELPDERAQIPRSEMKAKQCLKLVRAGDDKGVSFITPADDVGVGIGLVT